MKKKITDSNLLSKQRQATFKKAVAMVLSTLLIGGMVTPYYDSVQNVKADGVFDGRNMLYANKHSFETTNEYMDITYRVGTYEDGEFKFDPYGDWVELTYEINRKGTFWFIRNWRWFTIPENLESVQRLEFIKDGSRVGFFDAQTWKSNSRFVWSSGDADFASDWNRMTGNSDTSYNNSGNTLATLGEFKQNTTTLFMDWEGRGSVKTNFVIIGKIVDRTKPLYCLAGIHQDARDLHYNRGIKLQLPPKPLLSEGYKPALPELTEVKKLGALQQDEMTKVQKALFDKQDDDFKSKLKDGQNSIKVNADGSATITYKDDSTYTVPANSLVKRYIPYSERVRLRDAADTGVLNLQNLTQEEQAAVKKAVWEANKEDALFKEACLQEDDITVDKTGKATIKYKDGSTADIPAAMLVYKKASLADQVTPWIGVTTGVKNPGQLTPDEQAKVKEVLVNVNKQNSKLQNALKDGDNSIVVNKDGTATITYKDGSQDKLTANQLVYKLPSLADTTTITPPSRIGVKNAKKLEPAEVEEVKKQIFAKNPDLKNKLKGGENGLTIDDEGGNATFVFNDDSEAIMDGKRLVYTKGQASNPGKQTYTEGSYTYQITPIKVADMNNISNELLSDAARRFVYDNYEWMGKDNSDYSKEKAKKFLNEGGGKIASKAIFYLTEQKSEGKVKLIPHIASLGIKGPGFQDRGVSYISQGVKYGSLEIHGDKGTYEGESALLFTLTKDKLFYADGAAFNPDESKKDADAIIDDLKKQGLSEDDANKIKKELEDKGGSLTQDDINKALDKANQKAEEGKKKQDNDKAKEEAQKELEKLENLDPTKKKEFEEKIKNGTDPEKVRAELDKAKQQDAKDKEQKDKDKLKEKQKEEAKKAIEGMGDLPEDAKKKALEDIQNDSDENAIQKAVNDAKKKNQEEEKKRKDKEALTKAKEEAEKVIDSLPNLSPDEKTQYKQKIKDAADTAGIDNVIKEAKDKDAQKAKELADKKMKAQDEVNNLQNLTPEEKKEFNKKIGAATSEDEIKNAVKEAKEKDKQKEEEEKQKRKQAAQDNLQSEREQAKKRIGQLDGLDQTAKDKYIAQIDAAGDSAAIWQIVDEAEKENAKKKAKAEIAQMNNLSEQEKKEADTKIDNAGSADEVESILNEYRLKDDIKAALDEIEQLQYLNNKQKAKAKNLVQGSASKEELAKNLQDANELDSSMQRLDGVQKTATEKMPEDAAIANDPAKVQAKKDLQQKLKEAQDLLDKDQGTEQEKADVERLIKEIEELAKKLIPDGVTAQLIKDKLQAEIDKSTEIKDKTDDSTYPEASAKLKKNFEAALNAAQAAMTDQSITEQSKIDQLTENLKNARKALDGAMWDKLLQEIDAATQDQTKDKYKQEEAAVKTALDTALQQAQAAVAKHDNDAIELDKLPSQSEINDLTEKLVKARATLHGIALPDPKIKVDNKDEISETEKAEIIDKLKKDNTEINLQDVTIDNTTHKITFTFNDGTTAKEKNVSDVVVQKTDAEKANLQAPDTKVKVAHKNSLTEPEKAEILAKLQEKNPNGKIKSITVDEAADKVTVTYEDNSSNSPFKLSDLADEKTMAEKATLKAPTNKVKVDDMTAISDSEKTEIENAVKTANPDTAEVKIKTVEVNQAENKVKVTYQDDSVADMALSDAAVQKTKAEKAPAVAPADKIPVDDPNTMANLKDDEIAKIKEAVYEANKDKDGVTDKDNIEVKKDENKVIVKYDDNSTSELTLNTLVRAKTDAEKKPPVAPSAEQKVGVVDVNDMTKLTPEEEQKIKDAVYEANKQDTKVQKDNITVDKAEGTVNIKYPDNSIGKVQLKDVVRERTMAESTVLDKPENKIPVYELDKLSDEEIINVIDAIKEANKDKHIAKVEIEPTTGKITVTYEDNSVNDTSLKLQDLIRRRTMAERTEIIVPNPKVLVDDDSRISDHDVERVQKSIEKANLGKNIVDITVDKEKREVTITFSDKSSRTFSLELFYGKFTYDKEEQEPWYKAYEKENGNKLGKVSKTGETAAGGGALGSIIAALAYVFTRKKRR
ncbi:hypothetical protein PYS60_00060 [Amygdalobacter indicium]|uniref:hypothetical protein n=1 Tax=Amygdalobacter indicium TaxID=3029272 RepID=UPI0027AB151E|nr:hypothetical protein [Amygdalobacter indicium]WEG34357.1 hypothetical protein PYS60_00060 [Amygdalobacter indicium]